MELSNKSQNRKIDAMSKENRDAYFASGRVSIGRYSTIEVNSEGKKVSKTWYVAKIRGVIVGGGHDPWKHETQEAALKFGKEVLAEWRAERQA